MDRERYKVWMRVTNDWIRTAHSMRLSRPTDCFHQGTACLDSIDTVAEEILRANRTSGMRRAGQGPEPASHQLPWRLDQPHGEGLRRTDDHRPLAGAGTGEGCRGNSPFLLSSLMGMLGEKVRGSNGVSARAGL